MNSKRLFADLFYSLTSGILASIISVMFVAIAAQLRGIRNPFPDDDVSVIVFICGVALFAAREIFIKRSVVYFGTSVAAIIVAAIYSYDQLLVLLPALIVGPREAFDFFLYLIFPCFVMLSLSFSLQSSIARDEENGEDKK